MKPEGVKIGMRVRATDGYDMVVSSGMEGTVRAVQGSPLHAGVEWDGLTNGHHLASAEPPIMPPIKRGSGWWVFPSMLEPLPDTPTVHEKPVRKSRSYQPPKTSLDALKRLRKTSDNTVWRVLRCIGKRGRTCDEVEAILGTSHQSTSARIRDLVKAGRLQDTGKRRNTRTGNKATVWRETEW